MDTTGATGSARDLHGELPAWRSVIAIVAHPDDESFALGGVLGAFVDAGAKASVLSLTHGEASTLVGLDSDLASLRAAELRSAADALGLDAAELRNYPDGRLSEVAKDELVAVVVDEARRAGAEGFLVFEPSGVTGHPDHAAATEAALGAAEILDLPVLGWFVPEPVAERLNHECGTAFVGQVADHDDLAVRVDRDRQVVVSMAHASQAVPSSVLWRRLELLGDVEHLRWLRCQRTGRDSATSP